MPADLGKFRTIQPKARHVFEAIKIIQEAESEEEKVRQIRIHLVENLPFKQIMMWNFQSRIETMLPEGEPPYMKNDSDGEQHRLWEELRMFPYFVKSTKSIRLNRLKMETMFIGVLENLPAEEAEVLVATKDGKIEEKYGITPRLMYLADPTTFVEHAETASKPEEPVKEEGVAEKAEAKPKRKRRTKEEIAADKAAKEKAPKKPRGRKKAKPKDEPEASSE